MRQDGVMAFHRSHMNHKSDGWLADLQADSNTSPFATYTSAAESSGNQRRAELIRRSTMASTTMPAISPYAHWQAAPMPMDRDLSNAVRCSGSAATPHPFAGRCILFSAFSVQGFMPYPKILHTTFNTPCSGSSFLLSPHPLFTNLIHPRLSVYMYPSPLSATIVNCQAQSHRPLFTCYLLFNALLSSTS